MQSKEEHFGAFKKSSNIKFPLKVGSFIFKSKGSLMFVENLLVGMEFKKEPKINYDPHHVISLRKQANKNKPFDHQSIEGLAKQPICCSLWRLPDLMKINVLYQW